MKINLFLSHFVDLQQILEDTIAEFEYYAVYEPDPINCAIAIAIFKPTEMALNYGIEYLLRGNQIR